MELLVESRDAGEVRSHAYMARQAREVSKFKGSKRIFTEMEPGDYSVKVLLKSPGAKPDA